MRTENSVNHISKTNEGTFNTAETTNTNYEGIPTTEPFFILPKVQKVTDGARVGRNAPTHVCNEYWSPAQVSLKDDIETGVPGRLFRRALGGTPTDTVVSAGAVWDHTFAILPPQTGSILPSCNIISVLGAASFLLHGMMVDRIKFSQKAAQRGQYEADLVGSGKFTNPHGIASLPALANTQCLDGFRTTITYLDSDGLTTIDLSSLGKWIEYMVEYKNNIRTDKRRAGDPIQTVNTGSAAHVRSMPRGKSETNIQIVMDFNDLTDWQKSVKNEQLTDLKITHYGPIITGAYRHEFEIIVPLFSFDSPDTGDDEGDAATPINIIALEDPTTKGTIKGRIRNATATLL